jgi:leader peptidase (prepilin peptidase) / N-methyltransferase
MLIIFFILGLIVGSFLNVVIVRMQEVETLLGRSHCPHCKKQIRWYDNIPLLSYAILKTRCRDCGEKISWQYPAVEIGTGLIFALTAYFFFLNPAEPLSWITTIFYLGVFSMLIVIFVYDAKFMEIPMTVLWTAVAWTIAFLLIFDYLSFDASAGIFSSHIFSGALAGAVAFAFFFALSFFSKERWMGMGDAYVALLCGLIAGWPGIFLALVMAFSAGSVYGLILIGLKKKSMKSQIPFAPFLILGTAVSVFFYAPITNWYFGLFY